MRKTRFLVTISIAVILLGGIVALIPPVLAKHGDQALKARNGVTADRYFVYAYLLNPWNKTFLEKRGQAAYWEGNFKEALVLYQRAYRPTVNTADYYGWLGSIEFALGDYAAALGAYAKAGGVTNTTTAMSARTLNALVAASVGAGQYQQAQLFGVWAITRAVATGDMRSEARAYNNLGLAYAREGKYVGAENLLKDAIALWPANPFFYDSFGELYSRWQKPDRALQAYEMVLTLAPKFQDFRLPQLIATAREKIAALNNPQSK